MRGRLGCFLVLACGVSTACGGATQSDLFGGPGGSSGTTSSSSSSSSGSSGDVEPPTSPPPPPIGTAPVPPCAVKTYYRDRDGDEIGGSETKASCEPPDAEWTTVGGDCDDDDPDVFFGQTAYFPGPYTKKNGSKSFDYDCSNKEEQAPPAKKAATKCTLSGITCAGSGYIPAPRAGAGVDSLCGATKFQTCRPAASGNPAQCEAVISSAELPITCR